LVFPDRQRKRKRKQHLFGRKEKGYRTRGKKLFIQNMGISGARLSNCSKRGKEGLSSAAWGGVEQTPKGDGSEKGGIKRDLDTLGLKGKKPSFQGKVRGFDSLHRRGGGSPKGRFAGICPLLKIGTGGSIDNRYRGGGKQGRIGSRAQNRESPSIPQKEKRAYHSTLHNTSIDRGKRVIVILPWKSIDIEPGNLGTVF